MIRIDNYLINTKNIQYVYLSEEKLLLTIVFIGNNFLYFKANCSAELYMWFDLLNG